MAHEGKQPEAVEEALSPAQEADFVDFSQDRIEQKSPIYRGLINIERVVSCLFLIGVLVLVLTQVITRYVFSSPLSWTEESARLVMVWLTFMAAAFVSSRRSHITVDLIASLLPSSISRAVSVFAELAVILTAAVMSVSGVLMVLTVSGVDLPATGLPTSLLYGAALIGFVGIFLHSILALYLLIKHPEDEKDPALKAAELEGL